MPSDDRRHADPSTEQVVTKSDLNRDGDIDEIQLTSTATASSGDHRRLRQRRIGEQIDFDLDGDGRSTPRAAPIFDRQRRR